MNLANLLKTCHQHQLLKWVVWLLLGYHAYTDHYQGQGHSSRPTAALINIYDPLI